MPIVATITIGATRRQFDAEELREATELFRLIGYEQDRHEPVEEEFEKSADHSLISVQIYREKRSRFRRFKLRQGRKQGRRPWRGEQLAKRHQISF